jgi:iron(III) transport system permease protein
MVFAALIVLGAAPVVAAMASLLEASTATWELLGSPRVAGLVGRTTLVGLATAVGAALVGVPVARLLARRRGGLLPLLAALLPLPLILPPWMNGMAWSRGLPLSGFWGAVLLLTAALWPLVALFALRGLRDAGHAVEAARLARGPTAAFLAVELPLALPSVLSGMLLVFLFAVTDFGVVDFLSFNVAEPLTVLSTEIYQKWQRLGSGAQAAAVSLPALLLGLAALALMLVLERRHAGSFRGAGPVAETRPGLGVPGTLGVAAVLAVMLSPVAVFAGWAVELAEPLRPVVESRDEMLRSLGTGLGTGLLVAVVGVAAARLSLKLGARGELALLALALAPLAAPGVLFAIGSIRVWHHPANPLSELLYRSPVLLVLTSAGRFLPLGVLAARTLLLRQDPSPHEAARLTRVGLVRRWLGVDLPLLAPATGLACTLGYLLSLRELDVATLIPAGNATLVHKLYSQVHIASDSLTALLSLLLILLVIVPALAARLLGVPGVEAPRR